MSKCGVFFGPYFPVFGPEKTPYLDTFHAMLDKANLYGSLMSKITSKLIKRIKSDSFTEDFIKNDENINFGYFLEVDLEYPEQLESSQNELPFHPEKIKSEKHVKLICNLNDKGKCSSYQKPNRSFDSWTNIVKVSFWLKPYINLNTKLRKKSRKSLKKISSNL